MTEFDGVEEIPIEVDIIFFYLFKKLLANNRFLNIFSLRMRSLLVEDRNFSEITILRKGIRRSLLVGDKYYLTISMFR